MTECSPWAAARNPAPLAISAVPDPLRLQAGATDGTFVAVGDGQTAVPSDSVARRLRNAGPGGFFNAPAGPSTDIALTNVSFNT